MAYIKSWALEGCINAAIAYRDAGGREEFDEELYQKFLDDCHDSLEGDHYGVRESDIVRNSCFSAIVELGLEPNSVIDVLNGYGFDIVHDPMHGIAESNWCDGEFEVTDYECDGRRHAKGVCPVCGAVLIGKVFADCFISWGGDDSECCECHSKLSFGDM